MFFPKASLGKKLMILRFAYWLYARFFKVTSFGPISGLFRAYKWAPFQGLNVCFWFSLQLVAVSKEGLWHVIIPWFRCEFSDSQHVDLKMYCTVFFVHTLLHAHAGRCTRRSFFRGCTFTYIDVFFLLAFINVWLLRIWALASCCGGGEECSYVRPLAGLWIKTSGVFVVFLFVLLFPL